MKNILGPNTSKQDVRAKLHDRVASFKVISNSYDKVVTISGWNQVNYSHLKNFQKLILRNTDGIMTNRFKVSLKLQPMRPFDVQICKF